LPIALKKITSFLFLRLEFLETLASRWGRTLINVFDVIDILVIILLIHAF